jgi:hypothetical protein
MLQGASRAGKQIGTAVDSVRHRDPARHLHHRVRPARPRGLRGQRACLSPQAHRSGAVVGCDRTLEQALLSFRGKRKVAREHSARDSRGAEVAPQDRLPESGRALLVPSEQILWFQVQDGIVHATTAKDSFWVNYQLAELEAALPPEEFFRARREVLVNLSRIKEIKPYFKSSFLLVMSDAASTEIAVSERQARPLRQHLPGL